MDVKYTLKVGFRHETPLFRRVYTHFDERVADASNGRFKPFLGIFGLLVRAISSYMDILSELGDNLTMKQSCESDSKPARRKMENQAIKSPKFNSLLEWWKDGHRDSGIHYDWQEDTFEDAHRIFGADYEQTGGDVYVGILKLSENLFAVFSSDMIAIYKPIAKKFDNVFDILEDGNSETVFSCYADEVK